jgi:hypothetical protein
MLRNNVIEFLGVWGIADSIWLALNPRSWAHFWGRWIARIGGGGLAPRLVALLQIGLSLALITGRFSRERATRPSG